MKLINTILFTMFFLSCSLAQSNYWSQKSPYDLKLKRELIITGISGSMFAIGVSKEKNEAQTPFEMGSFTQADIDQINRFDRSFAGIWDVDAKDRGKIFKTTAFPLVPISLMLLPGDFQSRGTLAMIYAQGYFLNAGIVSFAKGSTQRYRPFSYLTLEKIETLTGEAREEFLEDVVDDDIEDSFYSGDAATTSFGLMFFAKVFNDYYPDSKWKYAVWGLSTVGTGLGAYYRAKSGKHFPTDVLVGSLVGGGLGILLPHLHKKSKKSNLSVTPMGNGLSLIYKM